MSRRARLSARLDGALVVCGRSECGHEIGRVIEPTAPGQPGWQDIGPDPEHGRRAVVLPAYFMRDGDGIYGASESARRRWIKTGQPTRRPLQGVPTTTVSGILPFNLPRAARCPQCHAVQRLDPVTLKVTANSVSLILEVQETPVE